MHKTIRYVYGFILSLSCANTGVDAATGFTAAGTSLMVGPGSQVINNITQVTSGYDPSMNFGNGTPTGVPVGGGMPILPGSNMPMFPPGASGMGAPVPWGQSGMIVPPLQQMMSTGMTPGMMPGSMPYGMMPSRFAPGMMPGMMAPGQAASMGVMSQLGPNASMMAALSGQAGTLGAAALGLPMNTGMGSMGPSGMMPGMSPFGGASLPGMPQNPSMMGMMMGMNPGMGFSGLSSMGMQGAMMMFSSQYQQQYNQMQATTFAKTFRIVSSLTNQALTSKSDAQLKKYQDDLENLVALPEEYLPEGVDATETDTQLSRINIALTDKGTLLADPDSTTVPQSGLRAERNTRLNALLSKWSTPDGAAATTTRPVTPLQPTPYAGASSGTGVMALVRTKQAIDKIEEDERLLTTAKSELSEKQDAEMLRRVGNALYNTLIAKAREYDKLMDSIPRQTWEQMIDQERGLSVSSLSAPLPAAPARSSFLRRSTPVRPTTLPTRSTTTSQFGRDEALDLQREIRTLFDQLSQHADMTVGGDAGLRAQLETHLQKLDKIVQAFNDPSVPNPFRSASPAMQTTLTLWTQLNTMALDDLEALTPQQLGGYVDTLQDVLTNPKTRLHPQIKYSEAQGLFDKLVAILASQEYDIANNKQSVATTGSFVKRLTTGGTRAKAMFGTGEQLVTFLQKGYFSRSSAQLRGDASWDAAVSMVRQINERATTSKVWANQSDRSTRVDNAQRALNQLWSKINSASGLAITATSLNSFSVSTLKSLWSNVSAYYYNADYATWSMESSATSAEPQAASAPRTAGTRSRLSGLFRRNSTNGGR